MDGKDKTELYKKALVGKTILDVDVTDGGQVEITFENSETIYFYEDRGETNSLQENTQG